MFFEPPSPPPPAPVAATAPVPFPHPLITEVLFAVPTEKAAKGDLTRCDANADGTRHVAGDEFIELFNPHDKPIQLKGYTISDRGAGYEPKPGDGAARKKDNSKFTFTFPALELKPGQVAVVFNGCDSKWSGPVGDSGLAPPGPNSKFANAFVFTARIRSSKVALGNSGDWVLLTSPDGKPVECVLWGDVTEGPQGCPLVEHAPEDPKGSVERDGPKPDFVPHADLHGVPFSPGLFSFSAPPATGDSSDSQQHKPSAAAPQAPAR